jgi:hypothetical protein
MDLEEQKNRLQREADDRERNRIALEAANAAVRNANHIAPAVMAAASQGVWPGPGPGPSATTADDAIAGLQQQLQQVAIDPLGTPEAQAAVRQQQMIDLLRFRQSNRRC